MCSRQRNAIRSALVIGIGLLFSPIYVHADVPVTQDATYLPYGQFGRHAVGPIRWDVRRVGAGEQKQLVVNGRMRSECLNFNGETATMSLERHPDPRKIDEMVIYINLTSACQQPRADLQLMESVNVQNVVSGSPADRAAFQANLVSLSSYFTGLSVPADFSGKISVCAFGADDPNAVDRRLQGNCSPLSLFDDGAGIVNPDGSIIGRAERAAMEAARANARQAEEDRAAAAAQYQEAIAQAMIVGRQACAGNMQAANAAIGRLARLANLGTSVRELVAQNVNGMIDGFRNRLRRAREMEDVDAVVAMIQRNRNFFRDEASYNRLLQAAIIRKVELLKASVADLDRTDSGRVGEIERDITALRGEARDLLGAREAASQMGAIEGVREALVNRALSNRQFDAARQIAQRGEEATTGEQQIRYARAQRRVTEKEFETCVNSAAGRATSSGNMAGLNGCQRLYQVAERDQRRYEAVARENGGAEAAEAARQERVAVFGNGGQSQMVQTPFGPIQQQGSYGVLGDAYLSAMNDLYQAQMLGNQFGGPGGFMNAGFNGGQMGPFSQFGNNPWQQMMMQQQQQQLMMRGGNPYMNAGYPGYQYGTPNTMNFRGGPFQQSYMGPQQYF